MAYKITPIEQRAIEAFEDRAAQRQCAAETLQKLHDAETGGLVKEELQRGIERMLNQQAEFLQHAEDLRKQAAGKVQECPAW